MWKRRGGGGGGVAIPSVCSALVQVVRVDQVRAGGVVWCRYGAALVMSGTGTTMSAPALPPRQSTHLYLDVSLGMKLIASASCLLIISLFTCRCAGAWAG